MRNDSPTSRAPPYYECLGVHPSISAEDLARHYKRLSLQLHPDRAAYRDDAVAEPAVQRRYQTVTEAYGVLSNPERRAAYDVRHGVNFHGRVSALQEAIQRHNATSTRRSERTVSDPPDAAEGGGKRVRKEADDTNDECDDAEDDDDEYCPEESAHASPLPRRPRPHVDEAGRLQNFDPQRISGLFAAYARSEWRYGGGGISYQHQKTVAVTRAAPHAPWGLTFQRNLLVASDPQHGAIPRPAVVTHLNHRRLRAGEHAVDVLLQAKQQAAVNPNESDHTRRSETPTQGTSEELQLQLVYTLREYDLVGDMHLLQFPAVMDALVPPSQTTPELPAILRGVMISAVNGIALQTAEDLRRELLRCAASEETGASGRPMAVVLECISAEGIHEESEKDTLQVHD